MEQRLKYAGYQYVYDPTHENKPDGIWNRTGSGWSRSDGEPSGRKPVSTSPDRDENAPSEHEKSVVEQPDEKPGENAVVLEEEDEGAEKGQDAGQPKGGEGAEGLKPLPAPSHSDGGEDGDSGEEDGLFSPENEDGFDTDDADETGDEGTGDAEGTDDADGEGAEVDDAELDALEEKYFGNDGENDDDPDAPADGEPSADEGTEEPSGEEETEVDQDDLDALEEKYFGDDDGGEGTGGESGEDGAEQVEQKEPENPEGDQLDDGAKDAYLDPAQFDGRVERMNSFISAFDGGEGKENDVTFKAVAANLDWSNIDDVKAFRDHCKRQNVDGAEETIAFLYHQHQADEQKFEEILDKMN